MFWLFTPLKFVVGAKLFLCYFYLLFIYFDNKANQVDSEIIVWKQHFLNEYENGK